MFNLEEFQRQIESMEARLSAYALHRKNKSKDSNGSDDIVLEELSTSFEELKVAQEELYTQSLELVQAYEEASTQRQRYESLFALAPDCYIVTDLQLNILEANHAAEALFGMPPPGMISQSLWSWVVLDDQQILSTFLQEIGVTQQTMDCEVHIKPPHHNSTLPCSVRASSVNKGISGYRFMIRDISELKKNEQKVLQYESRLRDLAVELARTEQKERRRLADELHDYLTQLLIVSRMKIEHVLKSPLAEPIVKTLREVDDIMDQSVKYTRTLIADLSPTILHTSGLTAATHWLAEQMKKNGLQVEVKQLGKSFTLSDDIASLIFQAIRELLVNVRKHAKSPAATVTLQGLNDYLAISVEDKGVGFDTGLDADTFVSDKYGLFSIKERLDALSGHIEVSSQSGEGTTVRLIVPLSDEKKQRDEVLSAAANTPALQPEEMELNPGNSAVRVLIVDDHDIVRRGVRNILESMPGLVVVGEGRDGQEAVELADVLHPEVILMDMKLPKMSGIEATRQIKSHMPSIFIIGFSAHEEDSISHSFRSAGADAFLNKGCPQEELFHTILAANREQGTGNREQGTGNREQGTGVR